MSENHVYPLQYDAPQPKRNRKLIAILTGLALVIGAVAIIGVMNFTKDSTDSGLKACSDMAERVQHPGSSDKSGSKMTEQQYKDIRRPFEQSKYADIKVAGQNLVDTVYKADQIDMDSADYNEAMGVLTQVRQNWTTLQVACQSHGVELPQAG